MRQMSIKEARAFAARDPRGYAELEEENNRNKLIARLRWLPAQDAQDREQTLADIERSLHGEAATESGPDLRFHALSVSVLLWVLIIAAIRFIAQR